MTRKVRLADAIRPCRREASHLGTAVPLMLGMPLLTVRSGRSAAVGVVTESVNVEATLSIGVVAGDIPSDGSGSRLRLLLENDSAANLGVTSENGNCSAENKSSANRILETCHWYRQCKIESIKGHWKRVGLKLPSRLFDAIVQRGCSKTRSNQLEQPLLQARSIIRATWDGKH